jgi:ubiquinone/menaquinone biosynthesis C-methylase UbiE
MAVSMTGNECECECTCTADVGDVAKMPGHWVLARMGKRVLRPGGLALTRRMLAALRIGAADHVVEFAPGLGVTARLVLAARPASYTGVERDDAAASQARRAIARPMTDESSTRVITGLAQETGLADASANVVYGEAMLTMQTETRKRQIIREAYRLLHDGGRYGIHELCLAPEDLPTDDAEQIRRAITSAIKHQAIPLTAAQWQALLKSEGFEIEHRATAPMKLLNPARLVRDEGLLGALRFSWRVLRDRAARKRVLTMRRTFRQLRNHIAAICLVARKPHRGTEV